MTNKVSIIVPCYNHAKYLEECIESIKDQSYSNWECIIVDDGSTDDTQSVSRKLENEKIRYVHQENKGLSGARNTGIRNATGDYILPLDADDTLNPLALEKMIAVFTQKPETLIVFSDTVTFGHTHKNLIYRKNLPSKNCFWETKCIVLPCLLKSILMKESYMMKN